MARHCDSRITITNNNVPKVLGSVLAVLADAELNVVDMVNKSRGDIAYNIIDIEGDLDQSIAAAIADVDGVVRVRII